MIQPQYAQPIQQYPQPVTGQGASAVSINIMNPQAFGAPAAQSPYTAPMYSYPQAQVYSPMPQQMPYQMPYMMPQQYPVPQYPVPQQYPPAEAYPVTQQPEMPPPVLAPEAAPVPQPAAQPAAPVSEPAATPAQSVDVAALNQELVSQDLNIQTEAITKIAQYSQVEPETALQLVDTQIMNNLASIIAKDTSALEGPTPEQAAIVEKLKKGEQLTPQEEQLFNQSSPREVAEKNKIFSMFTLAMLQKLQRDEIDAYNASVDPTQTVPALKLQDLAGYQQIVDAINTSPVPDVKSAGIQALVYSAQPEDAQAVQDALANVGKELQAAKDKAHPAVAQAYQEAMAKIAQPAATTQGVAA